MNRPNVGRGLNRIYLVLTIGWGIYCMAWLPFSTQNDLRKLKLDEASFAYEHCVEDGEQLPLERKVSWNDQCFARENASFDRAGKITAFSYQGAFWWLLLFAIAVPAVVYAIIYGVYLLGRWLAMGFRTQ